MIVGFTGTSHAPGMTQRQRATFRYLLNELQVTELHHGDCVNADEQADYDAHGMGITVHVHPPEDPKKRAFCRGLIHQVKPYLPRNKDIVAAGINGLLATPKDAVEPTNRRGQGTWTTVNYARKAKRRIWIIFPDGTFKEERP